jgi:hypothetical protein
MSNRSDKRSRKESLDHWKAERRAWARAALPMSDSEMQAFFDMLDVALPRQGCDHTLRLTRQWLTSRGLPVDEVSAWLNANGAICDCEALANAEQAWRDAITDVNW